MEKRFLAFWLIGLVTWSVMAATETVDGIVWTYTVSNGVASVGGGSSDSTAVSWLTAGEITVPSMLGGFSVRSIGERAFYRCDELTRVAIPLGVTNVGDEAFCDCWQLRSVDLPDGIEVLGAAAFRDCYRLKAISLPDSINTIGGWCFGECRTLRDVKLPGKLKSVEVNLFQGCTNLVSVSMPNGVESIGDSAFNSCYCLEEATIPETVVSIGSMAFASCSKLKKVHIPQAVCRLGASAIPIDFGTTVGDVVVIDGCAIRPINQTSIANLIVPDGIRVIADSAFYSMSSLTNIVLPKTLRYVGEEAFYSCKKLQSISFPTGVVEIGNSAMCDCFLIKNVIIPGSVRRIGDSAFSCCEYMENVSLGEGIEEIGDYAFHRAGYQNGYWGWSSRYIEMNIPSTVKKIGKWAFNNLGYNHACVTIADIGKWCEIDFADDFSTQWPSQYGYPCEQYREYKLKIPYGPKRISSYAFCNWSFYKSEMHLPYSVKRIEAYAFQNSSIVAVRIPKSVVQIDKNAFYKCSELTKVIVDDGDADRVRELMRTNASYGVNVDNLSFVERESSGETPTLEGDGDAEILGDEDSGFVVRPSASLTNVVVTVPQEIDPTNVRVEVPTSVKTVTPNGSVVRVVKTIGSEVVDLTEWLLLPVTDNGVVNITDATVKESVVRECLDVDSGATVQLNASNPEITTAATKEGLIYQFKEGSTIEELKSGALGESKVGDGKPWTPNITVKGGLTGFYSIGISF